MIEVNTSIFYINFKSLLGDLGITLYQNKAPKSAITPYTIFRLETIVDTSPSQIVSMKFICHDDQAKSSKGNVIIADKIETKFNKTFGVFSNGQGYHSTMSLRQEIPSEMLIETQVIELQFDIAVYGKGE
jgi:hypothetical protein